MPAPTSRLAERSDAAPSDIPPDSADLGRCRPAAPAPRPALACGPILVVAAVKLAVDALVSGRYGWHRDELYYADAGRHLALGYVDLPPVTAWLAALARVLFGDSLVGLRFVASLAGAGVVLVTAALCRDLGGSRRAQVLASVAIAPLLVGANALFQTVSFDQLTWALVLWATVRLLGDPTVGRWLALSAAAGLAWETKFTVATLFVGLVVGFATTRAGRSTLRPGAVLAAGALFLLAAAPNLWWQATHEWAGWHFVIDRSDAVRDEYPPWRFVAELVVMTGVPSVALALIGLRHLLEAHALRPLGIALAVVAPLSLVLGGKGYYAAPLAIGAFAAGAVALDGATGAWARYRRWLPVVVVVGTTLCSPIILPVLPERLAVSTGVIGARDDFAAQLGWPEVAADTARAWRSLPADRRAGTVVVAGNYGVAGALERFGPAAGLSAPVVSGHVSWAWWPLPEGAAGRRDVLAVGVGPGPAPTWCHQARRVGTTRGRPDVETEEQGWPIWSCRLDRTVAELRPDLTRS